MTEAEIPRLHEVQALAAYEAANDDDLEERIKASRLYMARMWNE